MIGARSARADEGLSPIHITYRAPPSCPGEAAFTSQVLQRTARVRLATRSDPNARPLAITLAQGPHGYSGRLELSGSDGNVLDRDVAGDSCEEVVSALALVTALALDPQASLQPIAPAPGTPPPAPPPSSTEPTLEPKPQAIPLKIGTAPSPAGESRPRSSAEPSSSPLHFAIGGDVAGRSGVSPDLVLVLPIFVELELTSLTPLAPVVRVSFERSQTDRIDTERGQASFRWTAASLEGCPLQWSRSVVRASPCLRIEGGVLEAEGRGIEPARGQSRAWVAFGAVGRAEWSFLEPAFADLGAGVVFPVIRDRFFFQPDTTVHRTAAAGGLVRAGLGLRFP